MPILLCCFGTGRSTCARLQRNAHFSLQLEGSTEIDNPDQRIQEDVEHFTAQTVELLWDALDHVACLQHEAL